MPGFCRITADAGTDLAAELAKTWFPFGGVRGDSFAYLAVRPAMDGEGVEFGATAYGVHGQGAATAVVEQIQAWSQRTSPRALVRILACWQRCSSASGSFGGAAKAPWRRLDLLTLVELTSLSGEPESTEPFADAPPPALDRSAPPPRPLNSPAEQPFSRHTRRLGHRLDRCAARPAAALAHTAPVARRSVADDAAPAKPVIRTMPDGALFHEMRAAAAAPVPIGFAEPDACRRTR